MERGSDGYIAVGRVTGLHGVRGKIKVAAFSGDPAGLLAAKSLRIDGGREPGAAREHEVESSHRAGGFAVFSLKGFGSVEDAEALAGAAVSMRRDELPPLPEDEFYWDDLVGCAVVDDAGSPIGEVVGVEPGPAHDWLVVRRAGGEEGLLPVGGAFLRSVEVAARRVVGTPPEGG